MPKIATNRPLLVMLYGFPGAGKSYFARQLCDQIQAAHVQSERIRAELFEQPRYDQQENAIVNQLAEYMMGEFLSAGVSVVYDGPALRSSQRHMMRDLARRAHAQPLLIWLQIDAESAYTRASKRDRRRIDDRYAQNLDRPTFQQAISRMQNPTMTEEYVVVSGKHLFSTQLGAIMKRLHELKLVSSDDLTARVVKPGMVNLVPQPTIGGRVDMKRRNVIIR